MSRRPPVTGIGRQALVIIAVFVACLAVSAVVLWLTMNTASWVWLTATVAAFLGSFSLGAYVINKLTGITATGEPGGRSEIEAGPGEWRWEQTPDGGWYSGPPQIENPTDPHNPTRGVGDGTPQ